jgi:hypothetical protein
MIRALILLLFATSCQAFDFGEALELARTGVKVTRWDDAFVYYLPGTSVSVSRPPLLGPFTFGQHIHQLPRLELCRPTVDLLTCGAYGPSLEDLLATDWRVN